MSFCMWFNNNSQIDYHHSSEKNVNWVVTIRQPDTGVIHLWWEYPDNPGILRLQDMMSGLLYGIDVNMKNNNNYILSNKEVLQLRIIHSRTVTMFWDFDYPITGPPTTQSVSLSAPTGIFKIQFNWNQAPAPGQYFLSNNVNTNKIDMYNNTSVTLSSSCTQVTMEYTGSTTSVENEAVPNKFELFQNYPNPFNPKTTIKFSLDKPQSVKLIVYSITGSVVKVIESNYLTSGVYNYVWDGTNGVGNQVSSGVYIYRLITDIKAETKKMMFIK